MILVVAGYEKGRLSRATYEMISAARGLRSDAAVTLLILGTGVDRLAEEATRICDQVLVADDPAFAAFHPEHWSEAVASVAADGEASIVLVAATRSGRAYSPRVAVRLDAPLLEDVIQLSRENGTTTAQRYSFLARATETIATDAPVVVASIKPGVFPPADPLEAQGEDYAVDITVAPSRVTISDRRSEESVRVSLTEADVVVAGGRGVGSAEGFAQFVVPLAEALGAAVGATRAVVDAGWRPYTEQVGQTGKTVQPKIYIAVGISGATQHLSGMNKSKLVIAINKDPDAPIFKSADYGLVGDVSRVVPALLARIRR